MKTEKAELMESDNAMMIMVRGEHTHDFVINAAIEQGLVEEEERDNLKDYNLEVSHFKAIPRAGYSAYYRQCGKSVRGAFLATILVNHY